MIGRKTPFYVTWGFDPSKPENLKIYKAWVIDTKAVAAEFLAFPTDTD